MNTIWKFPLEITKDEQEIMLPTGSRILCVQTQAQLGHHHGPNLVPILWAVVNPECKKHPLKIYIFGTGQPMDSHHKEYIGTFQMGHLVWHVFMEFGKCLI